MSAAHYLWWGKDRTGRWCQGRTRAESRGALAQALRAQRIRLCAHLRLPTITAALRSGSRRTLPRPHEVTQLSRQLATLLQAGLPLLQALSLMAQGMDTHATGHVLRDLGHQIENGASLSAAMRQHSVFDPTFCSLVEAGEASGQLDQMLERLASHREKAHALTQRLRTALLYPSLILLVGGLVSGLLLGFVVPAFEPLFQQAGAALPALTQTVLHLSRLLSQHGGPVGMVMVASGLLVRHGVRHTAIGRRTWDALRLRLPLLNDLTHHAQCARWCRTLATLLQAGLPIHDALRHVRSAVDHAHYQRATDQIQQRLHQGQALSVGLRAHPRLFAPLLVQLCAVGEESGTLDVMLARVADHHEQAVDRLTQRLATLLEPTVMLVLGLIMGTLVLALYWPIFQIGQVL